MLFVSRISFDNERKKILFSVFQDHSKDILYFFLTLDFYFSITKVQTKKITPLTVQNMFTKFI